MAISDQQRFATVLQDARKALQQLQKAIQQDGELLKKLDDDAQRAEEKHARRQAALDREIDVLVDEMDIEVVRYLKDGEDIDAAK